MAEHVSDRVTMVNVIVIVIVLVLVGVLLPVVMSFRSHRSGPTGMKNTTQIRGITQSLITYADGNNTYYPGLNTKGEVLDITVENRYWLMLDQNYFTGDYAISPSESKRAWTTGVVSSDHYSFSMLELEGDLGKEPDPGRGEEWRETISTQAIILSDRNTGTDAHAGVQSIHRSSSSGYWTGSIGRNDGSASFDSTHLQDTRYGKTGPVHIDDNLFEEAGADDAYMIYTGE